MAATARAPAQLRSFASLKDDMASSVVSERQRGLEPLLPFTDVSALPVILSAANGSQPLSDG